MSTFGWMEKVEALSPAALTVLAQTVSPIDNGRLLWGALFPRQDVGSVDLSQLTNINFRPVADRREWNQSGRLIPVKAPKTRKVEMVPIEARFSLGEREIQRLSERFLGNQSLLQQTMAVDVPNRTIKLAEADYRRLELDCFNAWVNGSITVRDPDTGESYDVDLEIDSGRYETAGTAWDDGGLNAYNEFIAWCRDANDSVGGIAGVALRYAPLLAILEDAPTLAGGASMSLANLADRVSQDIASPFRFLLVEDTVDVFSDGGIATTSTKKWPSAGKIAAIPSDQRIGNSMFAPVGRAVNLAQEVPGAGIDVNGVSVFRFEHNNGKQLDVEAQLNAVPLPEESRVAVIDTGVS
jgi:hypothetical protein